MILAWLAVLPQALGGATATEQALDAAGRLLVGQCRRATLDSGAYWTSQPGAIRSFDRVTGALKALHKLYSSPEPVLSDPARLAVDRPVAWDGDPARWVDLNEPTVRDGDTEYPIADPRSDAEGFSHTPAAGANPLPMPVAWMYVTRDGTLGSLDADRQFVPMSNPRTGRATAATVDNPLIARVAWWADDATCKININTASEGVFWDTPRCDTEEERAYGRFQPARGEWQRDMGHPAAVCLSSVLFPGQRLHLPGTTSAMTPLPLGTARALWRVTPGIPDAGSLGGTVVVNPGPAGVVEEIVSGLHADAAALAAEDELPAAAQSRVQRGGFFLTAHSRAPDVTRDGRPRLSLWPLNSPEWQSAVSGAATPSPETFTEFDGLMAAVSALHFRGTRQPWAVVRSDPRSQHAEVYNLEDGRNQLLAQKLHRYLIAPRTGFDSFGPKYGEGRLDDSWALVAGGLDFIRQTAINDPGLISAARFVPGVFPSAGAGQVTPLNFAGGEAAHTATWSIATRPLPRGYGRFPTVSEVALVIGLRNRTLAGQTPSGFYGDNQTAATALGSGFNHFEIEVAMLIEGFVPAHSVAGPSPRLSLTLGGYDWSWKLSQAASGENFDVGNITLNGRPLVFPNAAAARSTATTPRLGDVPTNRWISGGGGLGVRFMRDVIAFKPILFSEEPGTPAPRLNFSATPTGFNDSHLRLILTDQDAAVPANGMPDASNIIQFIPLAFPNISNGALTLPFDDPTPVAFRDSSANRLERSRVSGLLLGPDGLIHERDIVQSLVPNHGDFRLIAAKRGVLQGQGRFEENNDARRWPTFVGHPGYGVLRQAHALTEPDPGLNESLRLSAPYAGRLPLDVEDDGFFNGVEQALPGLPNTMTAPGLAYRADYPLKAWSAAVTPLIGQLSSSNLGRGALSGGTRMSLPTREVFNITRYDLIGTNAGDGPFSRGDARPDLTGDFDNGIGQAVDGPYINAPDPGDARAWASGGTPYFDGLEAGWVDNPGTFSPYRHMPSAMMFGSLPTGVQQNVPWQTLLFRPDPHRGTDLAHFGSRQLPDHHFADSFRMPVVKPSGVVNWNDPEAAWKASDAFSTEGRINMNQALVPFDHVRRTTALHALFKAQKVLAIPDEAGAIYKSGAGVQAWRHHIDPAETLKQWDSKFAGGDVFRTSSEIAEQWLVPEGATLEGMSTFWARHRLTGDNSKERPYANIYPHLTTRSLTYDVHVVSQEIVKAAGTPPDVMVPGVDAVGPRSQRLLRLTGRIDPKDPDLPDFVGAPSYGELQPLSAFIQWSVPGLLPVPVITPAWGEVTATATSEVETGVLRLQWTAAPGQVCLLETSENLVTWTARGSFRTGEFRDFAHGETRALDDPFLAEAWVPDTGSSGALHARLRWYPAPES